MATRNFLWAIAATALMLPCRAQAATDFGNTFLAPIDLPRGVLSIDADSFQSVASAGGYFALDDAAKPRSDPETYAMLAAGLGLIGFIVRRRNKVLNATD